MSDKESLVLVISRFQLDPVLIPPLKVIVPMLSSLYTVRVFTSLDKQIVPNKGTTIYEELVKKLQHNSGFCSLTNTLQGIIKQYEQMQSTNYRVCILGHESVDWAVIMEFKRRNIVVDTVCGLNEKNSMLIQISYITGGIHKAVKENNMIKAFQSQLGMSSKIRSMFKMEKKDAVQFTLKCCACPNEINRNFFGCSVCLAAYCARHENISKCQQCGYSFD